MWPKDFWGFLIFAWLVVIHVTAVVGLLTYPLPGWRILFAFTALAFLGAVGTVICYHRELAHKALKLNPAVRALMIFFAMLNGAAPPESWVSTHRLHHARADTPDDPSSPIWRGLWWAHVAWHWQTANPLRERYARSLRNLHLSIWNQLLIPMFLLAYFGGAYWSAAAFFWLGANRLVFAFHATSFVNSVCHTQQGVTLGGDCSRNVWWVGLMIFFLGENWHRNHHASPSSVRMGLSWREPDLGYQLILGLEKLGLATVVRQPITAN
jgi:stearoyl-CoA desaturase (delta-9 desaturase)